MQWEVTHQQQKIKYMKKNFKDKITNIAGVLIAISGTILTLQQNGIELPKIITTISLSMGIIGAATVAYLTGKTGDGKVKTE